MHWEAGTCYYTPATLPPSKGCVHSFHVSSLVGENTPQAEAPREMNFLEPMGQAHMQKPANLHTAPPSC